MPFLRVLRDKRGYETTYLMHWFREGHRQRSKILYVFRTPPGVRVGRLGFEPTVMRELEARYPDIDFEWRTLVENQQVVETSPELRRPRKRRGEGGGDARPERALPEPADAEPPAVEKPPVREVREVREERAATTESARPAATKPARSAIPLSIEGSTPEEQIAWLRTWHPKIREQIPHRTHDPARREVLDHLAARFDPDAWVGEEAVAQGLQAAAEALHRLSRVFARKRRRPRRKPQPGAAEGGGSTGTG